MLLLHCSSIDFPHLAGFFLSLALEMAFAGSSCTGVDGPAHTPYTESFLLYFRVLSTNTYPLRARTGRQKSISPPYPTSYYYSCVHFHRQLTEQILKTRKVLAFGERAYRKARKNNFYQRGISIAREQRAKRRS